MYALSSLRPGNSFSHLGFKLTAKIVILETVCAGADSAVKLQSTEINRNMLTEYCDKESDLISLRVDRQQCV